MDVEQVADDLESVVLTEEQIREGVARPATEPAEAYAGREPIFVGVDHRGRYRNLRCAAVLAPHVSGATPA